jgi:hypothetical protein
MVSDGLKIGGICLILLGGLFGLLSFFTDTPDLSIALRRAGSNGANSAAWLEMRGIATLEGKRLLLAIFGASSFASGVSMIVGGLILSALKDSPFR